MNCNIVFHWSILRFFKTETLLKPNTQDSFLSIPGFKILEKVSNEVHGGVPLMLSDHIKVDLCQKLNDINLKETLWAWQKAVNGHDNLIGIVILKKRYC